MEYKKSQPIHGKLGGRYATLYEYEFPRATRTKGKFLPLGSVRLREFLYCDGAHGQLVQIIVVSNANLAQNDEKRAMVDKILYLGRETKRFRKGDLTRRELTGEIREYNGDKLINLGQILADQEKIGLFASARRVKSSKMRQRRMKHWKIRFHLAMATFLFVLGGVCGVLLQKNGLLDLGENAFYQNYILTSISTLSKILS